MPVAHRDILLTGIPRSGTTLACRLLSELPGVVALNEPMRTAQYRSAADALAAIPAFYATTRQSILCAGVATARAVNGRMTDNHFTSVRGHRTKRVEKQPIRIVKPLRPDFRLVCKHNALFSILREQLVGRYAYFAIIRNPLAILASWNSVPIPAGRGEVRAMRYLLPATARRLERAGDLYARQLFILDWYFRQYQSLPAHRIIRYEQIVATGGKASKVIDPDAVSLRAALTNRNRSPIYDWEAMATVAARLLRAENACWSFYDKFQVEELLTPP